MKQGYIDATRGIAILMVILVHTSQSLELTSELISSLSKYGQMGVQLFFVASALTLCLSFCQRKDEPYSVVSFYIRRIFRIAPMYYVGIIGYLIFRTLLDSIPAGSLSIPAQYTPTNIFANIFFLHGLYKPANNNIVPGGWSIGTEMLFYAMFPVLMASLFNRMRSSHVMTLLFPFLVFSVVALIEAAFFKSMGYTIVRNSFIYYSILNQIPVFAVGISAYFLFEHHNSKIRLPGSATAFLLFLAISFLSIYVGWINPPESAFVFVPFISAISFFFLIVALKSSNFKALFLEKIGQRSYSMYIIHFVFAQQLSRFLNERFLVELVGNNIALCLTFLMTVLGAYILAGITETYIESYFIKKGSALIKKISGRQNPQPVKATAD